MNINKNRTGKTSSLFGSCLTKHVFHLRYQAVWSWGGRAHLDANQQHCADAWTKYASEDNAPASYSV